MTKTSWTASDKGGAVSWREHAVAKDVCATELRGEDGLLIPSTLMNLNARARRLSAGRSAMAHRLTISIVATALLGACGGSHVTPAHDAGIDAQVRPDGSVVWEGPEACFSLTPANEGDACTGSIECTGDGPCTSTTIWCEDGTIHARVVGPDGGCGPAPDAGPPHPSCDGLTPANAGEPCTGEWDCWPDGICPGGWYLACREARVFAVDLFANDCTVLAMRSPDLDVALCERCFGAPCGSDAECDRLFQCVRDSIYIGGCCLDRDCQGIAARPYCGPMLVCAPAP